MGGLTSPPVLSVGSSAGQVPEATILQTNRCTDGYNIGFLWTAEGVPTLNTVPQWDNGFVPVGLATANGVTSRLKSAVVNLYTTTAAPPTATDRVNCFSVYVMAWPNANPSPQCRFEATLLPSGTVLSLDVNPITGVLIAQAGAPASVAVERIVMPLIGKPGLLGGTENVPLYRISFSLDVGADTTAVLRCYPRTDGVAAGVAIFGGAQVEQQVSHPTAFITTGTRQAGNGPRQVSIPNLQQRILNASPYQVDGVADQDTWLQCNLLAGNIVTLPTAGTVLPDMPTGSRLLVTQSANAIGGITTINAAANSILAPGGITAAYTSLTFPSTDFPNVTQMLLIKTNVLNQWQILSTSAGGSGGGLFLQAGAGAVARTFQSKDRDIFSTRDFGVPEDGITPANAKMILALAAAAGKTLTIYGTPLLTQTLTITQPVKLVFDGTNYSSGTPGAHFVKDAALATEAIIVTAPGFEAYGGGVIGTGVLDPVTGVWSGSAPTGEGIRLAAVGAQWHYPYVTGCGGDGIRLGNDAIVIPPISGMRLIKPYTTGNNRHGIYVDDINDNCNDCVIEAPLSQFNNYEGIRIGSSNAGYNVANTVIIDPHCEANGWGVAGVGKRGWNLYLGNNSQRTTVIGGDCEKGGSAAGFGIPYQDVKVDTLSAGNVLINLGMSNLLTDLSNSTTIVNPVNANGTWYIPVAKFGNNPKPGELTACDGIIPALGVATITLTGFGTNGGAVLIAAGAVGYGVGSGTGQALFLYGPLGGGTAVGGTPVSVSNTGSVTISNMVGGAFTITNNNAGDSVRFSVSVMGSINSASPGPLLLTVT